MRARHAHQQRTNTARPGPNRRNSGRNPGNHGTTIRLLAAHVEREPRRGHRRYEVAEPSSAASSATDPWSDPHTVSHSSNTLSSAIA